MSISLLNKRKDVEMFIKSSMNCRDETVNSNLIISIRTAHHTIA